MSLYEQLQHWILKEATRFLLSAGEITGTADRLIWKLKQMGDKSMTGDDLKRLQPEYDKLAHDLTLQNGKYNDFCKANNLVPQYDRIKLADFGREQTKAANAGARRYKKEIEQ